jgi:prolyl-tRNA synthetase
MVRLGASKLSLSTFSSEELWQRTGRLESSKSELFQLEDRKGGKYLLSPTHEEEITSLVGSIVNSYKELPLRLYQISRKYRDEQRPRQGLLRTREFLMKDLYTFDATIEDALKTYDIVRQAYTEFFDEIKILYLTAEASSGEIGGDLSHEYHIPTPKGEDRIISCDACDYVANEELAESKVNTTLRRFNPQRKFEAAIDGTKLSTSFPKSGFAGEEDGERLIDGGQQAQLSANQWLGITKDRRTIVQAFLPKEVKVETADGVRTREPSINPYVLKSLCPQIDLSVKSPIAAWKEYRQALEAASEYVSPIIIQVFDIRHQLTHTARRLPDLLESLFQGKPKAEGDHEYHDLPPIYEYPSQMDLVRIETGDPCPRCPEGILKVQTAVELGHTFHLGTRYSKPLDATVTATESLQTLPQSNPNNTRQTASNSNQIPMQMGCHGIGVSRLIAAVADSLADANGLNWPRVMAPFEAVVVPTKGQEDGAEEVYDILTQKENPPVLDALDTILDDRKKEFGWKLKDADLIGYPIIVVVGRDWKKGRECEVQCRRLGVKRNVAAMELRGEIEKMLQQL